MATKQTPWWKAHFTRDTRDRALYVVSSAVLGLLYSISVLLGLALSLYTVLVVVGAFVLAGTFALARRIARWERARAASLLGLSVAAPAYRQPRRTGAVHRFGIRLRDRQTWKDIAYALVNLLIAGLCFAVVAMFVQLIFRAVSYPVIQLFETTYRSDWGGPTYLGAVAVHTGQGVFLLFFLPAILRGLTRLQVATIRKLIGAGPAGPLDRAGTTVHDGADGNFGTSRLGRPVAR